MNMGVITKIAFFIYSLILMAFLVYQHELVHKAIFDYFGVKGEIKFDWKDAYTIPENTSVDCRTFKEIGFLQILNEIFFYHFIVIFLYIFTIACIIIWRD
jgi:hypothetical protein